jgi:small subunit ribosomal protein S16
MGKKKRPFFRIVAADSRRARDGRFIEVLGTYNPIERPAVINVQEDRLTYWLDEGAIPSDTVGSLLTQIGFTEKYHKAKSGQDVAELEVKTTISERKKRTRKVKKAAIAKAEAEAAAKEEKAKEAAEASKEAPAEEAKAEAAAEPAAEEKTKEAAEEKAEDKAEEKAEDKAEKKPESES